MKKPSFQNFAGLALAALSVVLMATPASAKIGSCTDPISVPRCPRRDRFPRWRAAGER
jgi:hypothetical protein